MIYTELTIKALKLAYKAHEGAVDKTGMPYILHPVHLAEQMNDEAATLAAILHDVVEDTDWTLEALALEGFPCEVIDALALLTHEKGVPYMDYVRALSPNPIARAVKLADLAHNMDQSRFAACPNLLTPDAKAYFDKKYGEAWEYLSSL